MGRRRRASSYSEASSRVQNLQQSLAAGGMSQDQEIQVKLDLSDAQDQFDKFKKSIDDSAKSWGKSFAGMTGVSSLMNGVENSIANFGNQFLPGNLQGLANGLPGGLGGYVGAIREGLGDIDAAGSAAARLGGMGAAFAREGMPIDKDFMQSIAPMIQQQEKDAAKAQRDANDIVGNKVSSDLGDALYDAYAQMRRMLNLDATKQRR